MAYLGNCQHPGHLTMGWWAQASPEVQTQGPSPDTTASQRWWIERLAELGRRASDTLSSFSSGAVQAFWQTWEAADMQVSTQTE